MILADNSVWIEHFRAGGGLLSEFLKREEIAVHSFVVGELACGNLADRDGVLYELRRMPRAPLVSDDAVLDSLRTFALYGRGLGWVDVHLLASARESGYSLWTLDRRLHRAAKAEGIPSVGDGTRI